MLAVTGGAWLQSGLNRADKQLLIGASAIAFLMAVLTVAFAPESGNGESSVPSTYASGSGGAKAAFLLLQQLRYPVRRWENSPVQLSGDSAHQTLILAEPSVMPVRRERTAVLNFVRRGGRVLFCGRALEQFFPAARIIRQPPPESEKEFSPQIPSAYTRGAQRISLAPMAFWKELDGTQLSLYGDDLPVVVVWKLGAGEVLWWASASPLTNAGLKEQDNLALFLDAVSKIEDEPQREIYWDEYFHGERGSLWGYIAKTPIKWGLLQLAVVFAAILFTYSRRWGPVVAPRIATRLSPLEFVDTLGSLYRSADAGSVAVGVAYKHLRLAMLRALGLPANTSDRELAKIGSERFGWDGVQIFATLERAADESNRSRRARDVLGLVKDIAIYSRRLLPNRAS